MTLDAIPEERKERLKLLFQYIKLKREKNEAILLNFVCTHNSRRSQLAQIWAQTAADYYGIDCKTFSSGVEVTSFNARAVNAIETVGFKTIKGKGENPVYTIDNGFQSMSCFSKLIDDKTNPQSNFAAIMTCSHADENCPVVLGMEKRIALNYEDPGVYDGTALEEKMYLERSEQIAREMFYLFSKI